LYKLHIPQYNVKQEYFVCLLTTKMDTRVAEIVELKKLRTLI